MKVYLAILLQCAAFLNFSQAHDAYLYTYDTNPKSTSTQPITVSSTLGLSILSRRRGGTDDESVGSFDDEALGLVDALSGYQQPIFHSGSAAPYSKLFLRIEGYDRDVIPNTKINNPSVIISRPSDDYLLDTRLAGDEYCAHGENRMGDYSMSIEGAINHKYNVVQADGCNSIDFFEQPKLGPLGGLASAMLMVVNPSSSKPPSASFSKNFPTILAYLKDLAAKHNVQSTLLLLPSPANLTSSTSYLAKRGDDREESPLDLPPASTADFEAQPSIPFAAKSLASKIPSCFTSKSACENATNSCSGHGSCSASLVNKKCFQCKCQSTVVRTNPDGSVQRWSWGGLACEKKDISVPFWLFATFGVAMTSLIAGGIGLLYGMGSEELPSVLSAGVGGPRAQK